MLHNRSIISIAHAAALVVVVCACASAGSVESAAPTYGVYASGLAAPVVLQKLAKDAGVQINVEPGIGGALDLSLKSVTLTSALNVICATSGLEWEKLTPVDGREVYSVRAKKSAAAAVTAAASAPKETPAVAASAKKPADETPTSAAPAPQTGPKVRELHLNKAQLQLIMQGVPNYRANRVLEQWRQQGGSGGVRFSRPGGQMFPQGGYGSIPQNPSYYSGNYPWTGYPYQQQRVWRPGVPTTGTGPVTLPR